MAVIEISEPIQFRRWFIGLVTDVKPTGVRPGAVFFEIKADLTVAVYITQDGTNWRVLDIGDDTLAIELAKIPKSDAAVSWNATALAAIQAAVAAALTANASIPRILCSMDFWSLPQKTVAVPIAAADQTLPDITVAALPVGATVVVAHVMFKFRSLSNAGAANKLTNAQEIQIRDDGGGGWTDAINLVDDQFLVAAAAVDAPGDVVMGLINVAGAGFVDGNDTYNLIWDEAVADVAALTFNDVQMGLRIWYSV